VKTLLCDPSGRLSPSGASGDLAQAFHVSEALDLTDSRRPPRRVHPAARRALVLSGAMARGAYQAGAVRVLAERGWGFHRLVGMGAGALNATIAAVGLACERFEHAANVITELWQSDASSRVLAMLCRKGLVGEHEHGDEEVSRLVCDALQRVVETADEEQPERALGLTLVMTGISKARPRELLGAPVHFSHEDLLDRASWPRLAQAVIASAKFPDVIAFMRENDVPPIDSTDADAMPIHHVVQDAAIDEIVVILGRGMQGDSERQREEFENNDALVDCVVDAKIINTINQLERMNSQVRAELTRCTLSVGPNMSSVFMRGTRRRIEGRLGHRYRPVILVQPKSALRETALDMLGSRTIRDEHLYRGQEAARASLPVLADR